MILSRPVSAVAQGFLTLKKLPDHKFFKALFTDLGTGSSGMKKFSFAFILTLLCALPSLAQQAGYTFDNFDFTNGVQIEVAPPAPLAKKGKKNRRNKQAASSTEVQPTLLSYSSGVAMNASRSLDGFTTGDAQVDSIIVDAATRNGVDPVLIYATMHQESSFKPRAMSNKGARGLMQLMPGTAVRFGVTNIWDPRQNIEGGARYMRFLLNMFDGDVSLALAGYNAGEGAVLKYGRRIPPYNETQEYVRRISRRYALMRDPETAHSARPLTRSQVAAVREEKSVPLTIYEREVFAVRMPDGSLQLVSQ
jgi:soluble lytic murein transglycosylase-like protein